MTKIEMFEAIAAAVADNAEQVEFLEKEIEILRKRASRPRKPTKTQLENEAFQGVILEMLEGSEGMTASEVAKELGVTPQRAVPILKKLVAAEQVIRTEGKGKEKTRFTLA